MSELYPDTKMPSEKSERGATKKKRLDDLIPLRSLFRSSA